MERDAVIAHGMSMFLKERFMEASDGYVMHVCNACGMIASSRIKFPNIYKCDNCKDSTDISKIQVPYSFKLLSQELMALNIMPRIRTKKRTIDG